jgi:hypothetical protein
MSLKREAEQRFDKAGRRWDVRSLVTWLQSGIKFLEWANTFRSAAGGPGVFFLGGGRAEGSGG